VSTADTRRGLTFGVSAYLLWGLLPLYWPLLKPAGAVEILAHRMLWSLVVILVLLWWTHGFGAARAVFANRRQRTLLAIAAVVVSANWGVYIWGVNSGQVVETSLGYFINPLLTVLLGVALFHERLRSLQWVAVGIASVAIIVLAVDYGRLPWIALTLATTFALYGYLKKRAVVGAAESLAVETTVMAVPAAVTLLVLQLHGTLVFGHDGGGSNFLLMSTGLVTAVPLLLFAAATRRLPLSTVGLLQYLAPVLQFAVGVGIYHEPMPTARWIGFGLVWVALALLTADAARSRHRSRALERSVAPSAV
jgi:chloramphenicol-sensitive protein RarD